MSDSPDHFDKLTMEEKCGEIYRSQNIFIIICTECNGKLYNFQEFADHIRAEHTEDYKFIKDNLEEKGEYKSWLIGQYIPEIIVSDIELADKKPSTNQNKKTGPVMNATPFESITLEQPYEAAKAESIENDSSHEEDVEEDILKTNPTEFPEESYVKHENRGKNMKLSLEQRKAHFCKECDKRFISDGRLKLHQRKIHTLEKQFKCDRCKETFREERSLKKHLRVTHDGFQCLSCEKSYKSSASLREHMQIHRKTCDFACNVKNCEKSFKSLAKLRRHQRVHENIMKHVCDFCGYRTRERHVLVVHLRTHTGEKPFPCKICGKNFISASMVREHQATHAAQRKHECEVCSATFSAPKALYHHKHLHLGIKKFVCRLCDKAYSQAAGLSAHMRQHKVDGKIM